ncbi:MAG: carboxypeptidase regulatory-like domain-containing protein [Bdellovibrionales bacterium]|nr:carboxypeptidase regulatory-like domain-containing protein [Bdellovibrionales bacterium]
MTRLFFKIFTLVFFSVIGFGSSAAHAIVNDCETIDFSGHPAGTKINNQYSASDGITVTTVNTGGGPNQAIIFDSANPTGGDWDLATPGYGYGNNTALGNILIVAEDVVDNNPADGLVDDPDDEAGGGRIYFNFNEPTDVSEVTVIDMEGPETGTIRGYIGSTQVFSIPIPALGDNSVQTINISSLAIGLTKLKVHFSSSGGVDNLVYCREPETHRISGRALLQGSNTPISGVNISGSIGSTTTNGSGEYVFNNVPNGTYNLTASKIGYVVVSDPNPITISNCNKDNQNFILACAQGYIVKQGQCVPAFTISGRTLMSGSNQPVSGVSISGSIGSTTSNSNGEYSFSNITNGTYNLTASKPGYVVVSDPNPIVVSGANKENQNFYLACAPGYSFIGGQCIAVFSISGTATVEGSGAPLSGVSITASVGNASTNGSGAYTLSNVPNGTYTLTASKTGYQVVSDPNPVVVAGSNAVNQNFVLKCVSAICGFSDPEISIDASDGTFEDYVRLVWTTNSCAVSYQLYRVETGGSVFNNPLAISGPIPTTGQATMSFNDVSAVPNVIYDYAVRGLDSNGNKCTESNIDQGHRKGEINDCDGDGIPDEVELEQGTDPCDPGDFHPDLVSPAFAKWNTYLSQVNYLELTADGTEGIIALVTVFDINGNVTNTQQVVLEAGQEFHVDVNPLAVNKDTYGIVRIDWTALDGEERETASLAGRMTNYRPDPDGLNFSFVMAKQLRNAVKGKTFAMGNSFDPQGMGFLVPNWTEIINLDPVERLFQYNLYNQSGEKIATYWMPVPAMGERDLNAGHENGQGVYLAEVIPYDGDTNYTMTVSRYSSNHAGGSEALTYNYAFAAPGIKGTAAKQYAAITNESEGCNTAVNWVEVSNTLDESVIATATFRNAAGLDVGSTAITLSPKEQFHFNASAMLLANESGTVEVRGNKSGALIMQSVTYYHDCQNNLTQTAVASFGGIAGRSRQTGTYNRYIGIENKLNVFNVSSGSVDIDVNVYENGNLLSSVSDTLSSLNREIYDLNDEGVFQTSADTYGIVTVETPSDQQAVTEVRRVRRDPTNPSKVDFIISTRLN